MLLNQLPGTVAMPVDHWQPLSPHSAGLWWLTLDDVPDDAWSRWTTLLDDDERARASRFMHERDRRQYIASHALLRILLQQLAERPARSWRFIALSRGKPALHPDHRLADRRLERLAFNISHTSGAIVCAMTLDHAIGVDIEDVERSGRLLEIADAYFAPDELALLRAAPAERQRELFFRLWTLKESYIKAHGDGLSLPLDQFAFTLSPPAIAFTSAIRDDPAAWQFATLAPTATHILSLALRHGGTNPVGVVPYRVTHSDIDRSMTARTAESASSGGQSGGSRL
jgi:4'-phosphopantetheinyl transferase